MTEEKEKWEEKTEEERRGEEKAVMSCDVRVCIYEFGMCQAMIVFMRFLRR